MKLYNHWIKFKYKDRALCRTDEERATWVNDIEKAREAMQKDLNWCASNSTAVVEYGIKEKEDAGIVILEGELGDNGQSYEDFEITVGGVDLYTALYRMYQGNRVRLTMEILEGEPK